MKLILKHLKKCRHLIFLDLEGTQFSHEMIAFGAVRADLHRDGSMKKIHKGIKVYVQPKGKIGSYVAKLTGIEKELLDEAGVPYKDALEQLKKYSARIYNKCMFVTFGNHDLRILNQSLLASNDADAEIVKHICSHNIDFSTLLAEFVRDDKNNPLSLTNYCKLFSVTMEGVAHDPLYDALNLAKLYQAVYKNTGLIEMEYVKVLKNMKHLPSPIRKAVQHLANGEDVSAETFMKDVKETIS